MQLFTTLLPLALALISAASGAALPPGHPPIPAGTIPPVGHPNTSTIPTSKQAAHQARLLLLTETIGTLSTVFPQNNPHNSPHAPPVDVSEFPIGLMDYFAACDSALVSHPGNPSLLAMPIATTFRNAAKGSPITLSIAQSGTFSSPAAQPRVAILGRVKEHRDVDDETRAALERCFTKAHPDAKWWLPGNKAVHTSIWAEIDVEAVYFVGGFGNVAYIGWIPIEEFRGAEVSEEEVTRVIEERKREGTASGLIVQKGNGESL